MKIVGIIIAVIIIAFGGWYLMNTDVDTSGGSLPDVDVSATGGSLPDVDVDTPELSVETETRTIEVPVGLDVDAAEGSMVDDASKPEALENE